jgi:hypothetical protein
MRTPPEFIAAEMEFYEISLEDCFGCVSRMLQRRFREESLLKMKMRGETEFQQQFWMSIAILSMAMQSLNASENCRR